MVFEIILLCCGVYLLGAVIVMKVTGKIPAGLVNQRIKLERSHDIAGYIKYMFPRGVIFGLLLTVSAAVLFINYFVTVSPYIVLLVQLGYIAGVIYYAVCTIKAQNKFLF